MPTIRLNNLFDISKPFLIALIDVCGFNIPDYKFNTACEEFGIDEEEAMEKMMDSSEYEFIRLPEGWSVTYNYYVF